MYKRIAVFIAIFLAFFYVSSISYAGFHFGRIGAIKKKVGELREKVGEKIEKNTPSNPLPANGSINQDVNLDLSWTGGAGIYDVYFGMINPPTNLVSNDQSTTTYNPGILANNTTYYWKIVATDNYGASTSGPVWSFTTLAKSWGTAVLLETNTGDAEHPQIAMASNGNAIVVWNQSNDPSRHSVYANRYIAGSGWQGEELIGIVPLGVPNPQIAMDDAGNAIVVWEFDRRAYGIERICAKRYIAGSGWQEKEEIWYSLSWGIYDLQIAMDSNGNAIVVWGQFTTTSYTIAKTSYAICAKRYIAGSGWQEATSLTNAAGVSNPQIAMDNAGNAIVVWEKESSIYANCYTLSSGWKGEELIGTASLEVSNPQIAMDDAGNAIVVWDQREYGTVSYSIYANRYITGSGWQGAIPLTSATSVSMHPQIAMDDAGNAIVVWKEGGDIHQKRYITGSGWQGAIPLTSATSVSMHPQIAMDDAGNAIVVWDQREYGTIPYSICAKRYIAGSGWQGEERIEKSAWGVFYNSQIAMDSNGNVIAVWVQDDGINLNIWATCYK